jgi:hypothetical protein
MVRGYIIPHKDLIQRRSLAEQNEGEWYHAAYLWLENDIPGYKDKFNVGGSASPEKASEVWICRETTQSSGTCVKGEDNSSLSALNSTTGTWWAMIKAADETRLIARVRHERYKPGLTISPGTVRWRFWPSDETGWIFCPEGCCQICQGESCE